MLWIFTSHSLMSLFVCISVCLSVCLCVCLCLRLVEFGHYAMLWIVWILETCLLVTLRYVRKLYIWRHISHNTSPRSDRSLPSRSVCQYWVVHVTLLDLMCWRRLANERQSLMILKPPHKIYETKTMLSVASTAMYITRSSHDVRYRNFAVWCASAMTSSSSCRIIVKISALFD